MRLFIAIEFSNARKRELADWMATLSRELSDPEHRLRWVKENQLHLTLRFIGETPEDQLVRYRQALQQVAKDHVRFILGLSGVGHFGGRVVWVGVSHGMESLSALAKTIADATGTIAATQQKRRFSPHVTLARSKVNPRTIRMSDLTLQIAQKVFLDIPVNNFSLIQSKLTPSGAIYETLERFPLISSA